MSSLQTLIFYATPEHDCSYLEGQQATTMFVDPKANIDKGLYSKLSVLGFRRSGNHYYRPHCNAAKKIQNIHFTNHWLRKPIAQEDAYKMERAKNVAEKTCN